MNLKKKNTKEHRKVSIKMFGKLKKRSLIAKRLEKYCKYCNFGDILLWFST